MVMWAQKLGGQPQLQTMYKVTTLVLMLRVQQHWVTGPQQPTLVEYLSSVARAITRSEEPRLQRVISFRATLMMAFNSPREAYRIPIHSITSYKGISLALM